MTGIHSSDASSPVPPQPTHLKNSDQLGVHQGRSPCVTGHNMMSVLHPLGQLVIHPPPSCVIGGLLYCCCINLNACGCVSLRNFAVMSAPRSWLHQQHSQHTGWETKDSLQPSATGHIYSLTNCGGGATTAQTVSPLSSHTESRSSILDVVHTASVYVWVQSTSHRSHQCNKLPGGVLVARSRSLDLSLANTTHTRTPFSLTDNSSTPRAVNGHSLLIF